MINKGPNLDEILELWRNEIPYDLKGAFVYVNDTLTICKAIANQALPDDATNADVLTIYKLVSDRVNNPKEQEQLFKAEVCDLQSKIDFLEKRLKDFTYP